MAITEFGRAVRSERARVEATLQSMADELATTPAFLSALETGRKKIPDQWVSKIEGFFASKGVRISNLRQLADVANQQVSVEGLSPAQQMLVAGFARTNLDQSQLKSFEVLLSRAMKG
jgi:dihydroxyacetone kinase